MSNKRDVEIYGRVMGPATILKTVFRAALETRSERVFSG